MLQKRCMQLISHNLNMSVNNERMWSWPNFGHYLEGLRKTMKISNRIGGLQAEI
jgi:hypothetical protein